MRTFKGDNRLSKRTVPGVTFPVLSASETGASGGRPAQSPGFPFLVFDPAQKLTPGAPSQAKPYLRYSWLLSPRMNAGSS